MNFCSVIDNSEQYVCLCSPSSINLYRRKLGVNRHSTRHTSPLSADLQLLAGVWLRATETEISAALRALVAREGL